MGLDLRVNLVANNRTTTKSTTKMADNRRVAYFYDAEVGNYHFGQGRTSVVLLFEFLVHQIL